MLKNVAEQAKEEREKQRISCICIRLWSRNSGNEARAVRPRRRIWGKKSQGSRVVDDGVEGRKEGRKGALRWLNFGRGWPSEGSRLLENP